MSSVQNNMNRVTGMFSGMDTDGLVKAMTMTQQSKVDALNASVTKAEWKKELLTDFNNKIRVFRDTFGSALGTDNLLSKGAFASFSVSMADNSGVNILASASAKEGSYNIRVDQLATAATMQGQTLTDRITGLTDAELSKTSIENLSALPSGGFAQKISFSINGQDFEFGSDVSLKKIMEEVNKSDAGVTMSYSQATDRITISSKTMGAYNGNGSNSAKTIDFEDDSGFLAYLGLSEVTNGQDAVVYINGEQEPHRLDSNSITLDGVTMSFSRTTDEKGVDYTLKADYKPAIDRIKKMITAYNDLFKELNDAYNQKVQRDYKPLTADQREAFSEKEIESWEKKAREGLLYRDNTLSKLIENARGLLSKTLGGVGNLSSIGIATSKYAVGETSQLEIDEEKLMAALQQDPDRIYNIFAAPAEGGSDGGFMVQLNKMMDDYVGSIKSRDLQNLNNDIYNYTKNIKEQENKLATMSEKYYLQYAKLETSLGQMTNQQNFVSSMLGGGSSQ